MVDESCKHLFTDLSKLRELVLYPILSPASFAEDIAHLVFPSLESLQLGIMNISVVELETLVNAVTEAFPNLNSLQLKIESISHKGFAGVSLIPGKLCYEINL